MEKENLKLMCQKAIIEKNEITRLYAKEAMEKEGRLMEILSALNLTSEEMRSAVLYYRTGLGRAVVSTVCPQRAKAAIG